MVPLHFFPMTDIVVMCQDPESADMSNPRGYVYGYSSYVVAESSIGQRVRLYVSSDYHEQEPFYKAEQLANCLNARLNNLKKLPVNFSKWQEYFPAYGSEAYSEEDTIAWERRLDEEEDYL